MWATSVLNEVIYCKKVSVCQSFFTHFLSLICALVLTAFEMLDKFYEK